MNTLKDSNKEAIEQKRKIYFYQGFSEPHIVANSLNELIKDVNVSDGYIGSVNEEIKEEIELYAIDDYEYLKSSLTDYGLYIDPVKSDFYDFNRSVGLEKDRYVENFK